MGAVWAAALAGCGSSPSTGTARPHTPSPVPTATGPAPTQAQLTEIYAQLDPAAPGGGCARGTATPSWAACPLTGRLVAALNASLSSQTGPGADPLCGCQAFDPQQVVSYVSGTPPGGGTIHVTSFGAPHVAYTVVPSQGRYLVDDIVYCTPLPHSIYAGETVSSC